MDELSKLSQDEGWCMRQMRRFYFLTALVCTTAFVLSYYAGFWFSVLYHYKMPQVGGLWSAISAIMVFSSLNEGVIKASGLRVIGCFIGALLAMTFVYIFGYTIFAFGFSIFFSVVICKVVNFASTYKTALITIAVICIVGGLIQEPPWLEALSRFAENVIGLGVTIIVVVCFYPLRKQLNLFRPMK